MAPSAPSKQGSSLYLQVLIAIGLGVALGVLAPDTAKAMKPLGDAFVKLVKMVIGPVILCTVTLGIAGMRELRQVGRVGIKALFYFEVVSTLALALGLLVVNLVQPGRGFHVDVATLDTSGLAAYQGRAPATTVEFLLAIIPTTPVDALSKGELLAILFFAVLLGLACARTGEAARPFVAVLESFRDVTFTMVAMLMRLAPVGAFGAMAFTVGAFGAGSLLRLAHLMGAFYATCLLFLALVLAPVMRLVGGRLLPLLRHLREELLLVLGTSSSESALPGLVRKLEGLGCEPAVVGLVVPTGYSFNLDGTNIYMTMAALFVAQATDIELSLGQQLAILGVAMVSSKGAAGVTGSGFITLGATLAVVPEIPVAGMALLLGVDRFMSEARALTNFVGNAVATLAVARWEGALDAEALAKGLSDHAPPILAERPKT